MQILKLYIMQNKNLWHEKFMNIPLKKSLYYKYVIKERGREKACVSVSVRMSTKFFLI